MSDSYAFYFSSNDCTHIAPIKTLTTLLKQLTITSFLFVPCAHNILLDYFASDHTLPKIARGSTDPLTVLKGSHPLKLFQLYQTCVLGYFTLDQFEFFSFNINTFGVLSHNKIKTIIFSFLKSLPISPDIGSIFTHHIAWCKKWVLTPFPCACGFYP